MILMYFEAAENEFGEGNATTSKQFFLTYRMSYSAIACRDGHGLDPSMGWVELGWVGFSGICSGLGWMTL